MNINNNSDLHLLANTVLQDYAMVPEKLTQIQNKGLKTVWKFLYNGQTYCLKRLRHPVEKALFSVSAQMQIYEKGGNVAKVFLNSKGSGITEYMDQVFILYSWLDGRDLKFRNPSDLSAGLEGLSEFHQASKGYLPPENARISSKLGKWPNQYESMKNRMVEWKEEAKLKSHQSGYSSYLKYVDGILEIADMAAKALQQSSYDKLTAIAPEQSSLCHQDYGDGNAVLSGERVYVLDLDGVTYDLPARDLRKIIGKQMAKQNLWSKDSIETILGFYEKKHPLSSQERELLMIDLLYPHWFFGDVKNLFQKGKLVSDAKIGNIAKLEHSKVEILSNFYN